MSVIWRGKRLLLYRRVPARYVGVNSRTFVKMSLGTDSLEVAETKAPVVWQQLVEGWEAKLAGHDADAERAFEAARELAETRGFKYLHRSAVAELPTEDLLARLEAVNRAPGAKPDMAEATALLGGADVPKITLSKALESYWSLARDRTLGKSEDQLRRWRNPRVKAIKNLIAVVGDKSIDELTSDDMLEFRDWWMERIETEGLTPNSGNKDLIHAGDVLKTVNRMKHLGLVLPLSELSFKEGEAGKRPPFSDEWIRDRLLAPGALNGMNAEAAAILKAMVNTGCRPSEIASLTGAQIHLDGPAPYISIEPEGRALKSRNARRRIVLTGASLEAMGRFPAGFPRYMRNSAGLSATVNKYLRTKGLLETPRHSLYSLRHAFEDRMLRHGVDERVRRDLMGHALGRERYGEGASLEHQREILAPFAL